MRALSSDPLGRDDFWRRSGAFHDVAVFGGEGGPTPCKLLARLGVLFAIALGFGLAAQVLVGLSN